MDIKGKGIDGLKEGGGRWRDKGGGRDARRKCFGWSIVEGSVLEGEGKKKRGW